jgi:hypothetical protein
MSEALAIPHDELGNQNQGQVSGYDPSPEELKAIKLVEHCYSKAKQARKPHDEKWLDYYRMFRGRQWKDNRPSYRHAEVINLIFRAIQSEVPIVMDTRPKIEYVPTEPGDLELASILNEVLESDWNDGNWLYKLTEMTYDSRFYGTGMASMKYDPDASHGEGRITFDSEDPFCVFPDPYARNVNEKANYFCFAEPQPVDLLKRKYPKHAQYIKPDLMDLSKYDRDNWSESIRYKKAGDSRIFTEGSSQYNLESKDEAMEMTLYILDYECVEEEVKGVDKESGLESSSYLQKLKYPNGRKIVTVGGVLVEDGPMEYEDGKFPFVRLVNYMLPREFWGISEVEQLESPQKIFNKLISFSLDVLTLMGNPIWIVDTDSGVDTDNLFNRPGLVIEKEKGSEVRREEGVHLQPYVLQMIDSLKLWFDDISGSNDVSRGQRPEGVTAASAITALQEAQQTRIRQKARNADACLQDLGKMYSARVFQFYDSPRIFRVTGENNTMKYFKFHVDKVPVLHEVTGEPTGEVQSVAKIRTMVNDENGVPKESEEKAYQVRGEFDVRVVSGSGLPFEKARIEQQSLNLFDRGIIDGEEVLKNIKYTNAPAVLSRMAEKAAMQAKAQADAEMQKHLVKNGGIPTGP